MIKIKNKQLIEFRKTKKLSSLAMAEKIGISKSFYEKIEAGLRSPSYNFLKKFKEAFPEANIQKFFL